MGLTHLELETLKQAGGDPVVFLQGLGEAILGYEPTLSVVVYDTRKVIEVLMREYKMDWEGATCFFEDKIQGAPESDHAPLFVERPLQN